MKKLIAVALILNTLNLYSQDTIPPLPDTEEEPLIDISKTFSINYFKYEKNDSSAYWLLKETYYKITETSEKDISVLTKYIKIANYFLDNCPRCEGEKWKEDGNDCLYIDAYHIGLNTVFLSNVYRFRADYKFKKEDYYGAISDYGKAIYVQEQDDFGYVKIEEIYYNIGLCYAKLGDKKSACLNWSKAGELGYDKAYDMIKEYCNR